MTARLNTSVYTYSALLNLQKSTAGLITSEKVLSGKCAFSSRLDRQRDTAGWSAGGDVFPCTGELR
jgi:hypothetical protein